MNLTDGLESRAPSLRVTLNRRMRSGRSWHVGVLRLAPDNVAITAAVGGLAVQRRAANGRLLLRAFGEGGAGRVESRYDIGGSFVDAGGGVNRYVPVWETESRDGLGFGGGLTVERTVFRHTILEANLAGWSFGVPENSPDAPNFYFGGGVLFGR